MQSVGAYLRDHRLARGLSLEEVARATRVGQDYLAAIERDSFKELPAPVFTKGFVRAYCQVLGEPPDEALSRYRAILAESLPPPSPPAPVVASGKRAWGAVWVSLALLIVLGLGLFFINLGKTPPRPLQPVTESARPAPALGEPPAPPGVSLKKSEAPAVSRLVARTSEPTWIQVQMDHGRVVEELLPAGVTREWTSGTRFVVTIGNAGGVTFELNGRPLPPLGGRGAVIRQLVLQP